MGLAILMGVLILSGCNLTTTTQATAPIPPTPAPSPTPADGWKHVATGVLTKNLTIEPPYVVAEFEVVVVRIDPQAVEFQVHYEPRQWYTMGEWRDLLRDEVVILNANFFSPEAEAVGLVVSDGLPYGRTFRGYGGMFQVQDDVARVRSLVSNPYVPEQFDHAVQGFPMLIEAGGNLARTGRGFDDLARRTVIAQDSAGHILMLITPTGNITFRNLMQWLQQSPLDIDIAFNLDGGKSTGMVLDGRIYPSINPIPVVIAVYPRN